MTHEEFGYLDGAPGTRADEVFTSLQSGAKDQDCNGHGTHVAGTVGGLTYGPAKNVSLHAVRSLECLGNGTVSQVGALACLTGSGLIRQGVGCTAWACLVVSPGGVSGPGQPMSSEAKQRCEKSDRSRPLARL